MRSAREHTLQMVSDLSQQQSDASPGYRKWSVGEILDHLILSETLIREEIEELIRLKNAGRRPVLHRSASDFNTVPFFLPKFALPFLEVPLTVFSTFVPNVVRDAVLRHSVIPARAADSASPRKGRPKDELLEELRSSFEQTEKLFDSNPNLDFSELVHQHPMLGFQNVPQLLRTLALHEKRHQSQISTVLAELERK